MKGQEGKDHMGGDIYNDTFIEKKLNIVWLDPTQRRVVRFYKKLVDI